MPIGPFVALAPARKKKKFSFSSLYGTILCEMCKYIRDRKTSKGKVKIQDQSKIWTYLLIE